MEDLKNPIIVALDVDQAQKALDLARSLKDCVGAFKIGPRLLLRSGGGLIKDLANLAPVFVDQKFYDIPSTMQGAVQACFDQGARFVTVHASSGLTALKCLSLLEKQLQQKRSFHILSVSILTSFSDQNLIPNMKSLSLLDHVKILVDLTVESGLSSVVCSPLEVRTIKKAYPHLNIITPGIRLQKTDGADDQHRTMTPLEAIENGASALVIGRPIIHSEDPRQTTLQILKTLPS